jgi:hypothetical protein
MRPADTSPEAWRVFLDLQRRMTPAEKIQLAFEWSAAVRRVAEQGVRRRYPGAGEREVFLRCARLVLGEELFRRVHFGEIDCGSSG